jgi:ribulose-phosphate 3-epimerase
MSKSVRLVPAILTDDPIALGKMVLQTETFTDFAQFDIMDGQFVPSRSVTCADIAAVSPKVNWEAHLMVVHPEDYLEEFKQAGAQKIVFHYEATSSPVEVIKQIRDLGMEAGLAINPKTTNESIEPLVKSVDSVLYLSVNPGFYGAPFIPEVLDKINKFHKTHASVNIGIDGGVKEGNIAEIARTGVNDICIGSAVFRQPDPAQSYRRLSAIARANTPYQ